MSTLGPNCRPRRPPNCSPPSHPTRRGLPCPWSTSRSTRRTACSASAAAASRPSPPPISRASRWRSSCPAWRSSACPRRRRPPAVPVRQRAVELDDNALLSDMVASARQC